MKLILMAVLTVFCASAFADLNIYSDRPTEKLDPIVKAFQDKTGTTVNVLSLKATEIHKRLVAEGTNSPADVAIVKDMVYGNDLVRSKVMQPLNSEFVKENVRPSMVSEYWTAITFRARTLVYDKSFDVSNINTYADLANPKYEGTLCLRTSKSTYNQALGASLVASYGEEETFDILSGWLDNQADVTNIYTSDSQIIKDIALQNGTCTLGVTNSYYLGLLLLKDPNLPVGIKFLQLKDGGASTNGIVAGITAASKQADLGRQFIEFMLNEESQKSFSKANQDFPANKNIAFPVNIKDWTGFKTTEMMWKDYVQKVPVAKDIFVELDYL